MTQHSNTVGGSTANRYLNCLGSTRECKGVPLKPDSVHAATGTALHEIMETVLRDDLDDDAVNAYVGKVVEVPARPTPFDPDPKPFEVTITQEMLDSQIWPALEWFDDILRPDEFWLEHKAEFGEEMVGAYGTVDVVFRRGNSYGVVDWKFGNHIVEAKDNSQLKFYLSAMLYEEWFASKDGHYGAIIYQPLLDPPEDYVPVREDVFSEEQLLDFEDQLIEAREIQERGDAPATPGPWCRWCPAEEVCSAKVNKGAEALKSLNLKEIDTTAKQIQKTVDALEDGESREEYLQRLHDAYLLAKEVDTWASAVKRAVKAEFDSHNGIDGLKRVALRNYYHWGDIKKTENFLRRRGFKVADYREPGALKSVAKIKKMLKDSDIDVELLTPLIETGVDQTTIVSEDDPRPALVTTVNESAKVLQNALADTGE